MGDIIFGVMAAVNGDFSWSAYGQHKVISLAITLISGGVGAYLSKGAQATKIGVGVATKQAITRAIVKAVSFEVIGGVANALVSLGAEEVVNAIMKEIQGSHLMTAFRKFTNSSGYKYLVNTATQKMSDMYHAHGKAIAVDINACIGRCMASVTGGSIAQEIFGNVSKVAGGVAKGFSQAGNKLGGKKTGKGVFLLLIGQIISGIVKAAGVIAALTQLCSVCGDFYTALVKELDQVQHNYSSRGQQKHNQFERVNGDVEAGRDMAKAEE